MADLQGQKPCETLQKLQRSNVPSNSSYYMDLEQRCKAITQQNQLQKPVKSNSIYWWLGGGVLITVTGLFFFLKNK